MEIFKLVGRIVLEGGQRVNDALNDIGDKATRVGGQMTKFGGVMAGVGSGMAAPFAAGAGAIGVALGSAIGVAMDFEAQMDRVGAISGATADQMQQLNDVALELGASTSKSASEVAVGMENMAAMGFQVNEIIGAMPGIIAAAEASGSDMAQVADVMASTLNMFNLEATEANRVADILAQTANQSAADINDMQYALKYAGPPAAALGIGLEELSASIGIMTNSGMKGEQAGTTLRAALLGLLDPSEENIKLMDRMGIQITDAQGNFVGIEQLVRNLSSSMDGMTDTQKAATLSQLVGTEAVSGMLSLMAAGPEEIASMTTALENSGGASAETAAIMKDNLKGAVDELSGAFETVQIAVGTHLTPILTALAEKVQSVADWFNGLSEEQQAFIVKAIAITGVVLGVVAVLGTLLAGVGFMTMGIGSLVQGFGLFLRFLPMVGSALAFLVSPVGLVIVAITALAALAIYLWKNWETIGPKLAALWESVKTAMITAWESVKAWFAGLWESIKTIFNSLWQSFLNNTPWGYVIRAIMANWNEIIQFFQILWGTVKALFQIAWNAISAFLTPVITGIRNVITTYFNYIKTVITTVMNGIKTGISTAFNFVKSIITSVVNSIYSVVSGVFNRVRSAMEGPINTAKGVISSALNSIKNMFSGLKLSFPRPKLPHFNVTQATKKIAGVSVPYPKVSIDWYETGGIFDSASIIGVGEGSSREAVVPLEGRYMRPFAEAIASQIPGFGGGGLAEVVVPVYLNGREIARAVAPNMDTELERNRRISNRGRGRG